SIVHRNSKKIYWWNCPHGHSWLAKVSERTVDKIPCTKCEEEFLQNLPQLLILLYARQNRLRVVFGTDALVGIPIDILIPELMLAIDYLPDKKMMTNAQKVKDHVLKSRGYEYVLFQAEKTAEGITEQIRALFRRQHIYIDSDAASDIRICRKQFEILRRNEEDEG
ncbi:MAG: zinc-ribbon domain-containing protein, partial [Blautia sp.]|nr:zinc-ribbon domain-containing protein [Blautia sp.]